MPTIVIEGREVDVDNSFMSLTPEQQNATVDEIAGSIGAQSSEKGKVSLLSDIISSAGAGLRNGIESAAGMLGDANKWQGNLLEAGAEKLGFSDDTASAIGNAGEWLSPMPAAPKTEAIRAVTNNVIGEAHEPETVAGEYARTVGEFAPAALTGIGGVARKAAMVTVPAFASETAGQMTKGTEAEPYARMAAGIVGGLASSGGLSSAMKEAAKDAPTKAVLKQQTDDLYQTMRDAGIKYDANAFADTILGMAGDLKKQGYRPSFAKEAFDLVKDLAKEVGKSPDFDDINGLIQQVGAASRAAARSPDGGSRAAALGIIRDALDDFERTAVMIGKLPKDEFNQLRQTARATALKNIKSRAIDDIVENSKNYASGQEAGIRNGINSLLRSKRGKQLFTEAEKEALRDVSNGRKLIQTLSRFGFDITSLNGNAAYLPTISTLGAGYIGGPLIAGTVAATGTAAKIASPNLTKRALDQTQSALRSGKLNEAATNNTVSLENKRKMIQQLLNVGITENSAIPSY